LGNFYFTSFQSTALYPRYFKMKESPALLRSKWMPWFYSGWFTNHTELFIWHVWNWMSTKFNRKFTYL